MKALRNFERRHRSKTEGSAQKSTDLPADYVKIVNQVFAANFEAGLKELKKLGSKPRFEASGQIFAEEIIVSVSLLNEGQLGATTLHASTDFDPKASQPTVQDLLAACIDAIGTVFQDLMDSSKKGKLEALLGESLSALEDVPYDWTPVEVDRRKIFLKTDKSNPHIEKMAEDWLAKNDPDHSKREAEEHEETEKLFVTGERSKKPSGSGSGFKH